MRDLLNKTSWFTVLKLDVSFFKDFVEPLVLNADHMHSAKLVSSSI